ncbi:cupin domain-containing protein [Paractinoplanes globisporus]|uniref:Cupin domain-containing protein n=1 Tax=Paractinoplanes globisporus TaxID=113565 RepID=A0ABW6W7M8_9ACTN
MKRIVLEPGAIREPQWNVNANRLAYCVSGTVLVAALGNGDSFSSFSAFDRCPTPACSTSRDNTHPSRTPTGTRAWPEGSSGPPSTTCRCIRFRSRRTACVSRIGTR